MSARLAQGADSADYDDFGMVGSGISGGKVSFIFLNKIAT
jgi:hypothetical protein